MNLNLIQSKNMKQYILKTGFCAAMLALAACSSTAPTQMNASTDASNIATNVTFPNPSSAWLNEGDFVNVDNLRKVAPGLSKDQLYYLINRPHFSEGIFGVRKWNYLFNFRTGVNNEYVTCQYQIHFDGSERVTQTFWKDADCQKFLEPAPAQIIREIVKEPTTIVNNTSSPVQKFNLAGDVLFAFNRHTLSDLRLGGRAELDRILTELRTYKTIDLVRVTGHTDPLSNSDYNFDLAYKRANTVVSYFSSNGISRQVLQAKSAGETEVIKPIQACASNNSRKGSAYLQECLAPNRRVVVEVYGTK